MTDSFGRNRIGESIQLNRSMFSRSECVKQFERYRTGCKSEVDSQFRREILGGHTTGVCYDWEHRELACSLHPLPIEPPKTRT